MRKLRKWDNYALFFGAVSRSISNILCSKNNRSRTLAGLVFCFVLLFSSLVSAQGLHKDSGAGGQLEVSPISVGDNVPEMIWNIPLTMTSKDGETSVITLKAYRGKTIILDFWATWCLSCIAAMPKLHNIADSFPNDVVLVPVSNESAETVSKFLKLTVAKPMEALKEHFRSVVDGRILQELIPHRAIPHLGIINSAGVLEQSTAVHLIDSEIIKNIVQNRQYEIPVHRPRLDTTLLSKTFKDVHSTYPFYYTTVSGYLSGFSSRVGHVADSVEKIKRGYRLNQPILQLFNYAMGNGYAVLPSRRLFLLDDYKEIEYKSSRNIDYREAVYSYSYEYAVPMTMSYQELRSKLLNDLHSYTRYFGKTISRKLPCIVLTLSKASIPLPHSQSLPLFVVDGKSVGKSAQYYGRSEGGAINYIRGMKPKAIVRLLNDLNDGVLPFLIDQTLAEYAIDLDLSADIYNVDALLEAFRSQGISANLEVREQDMFVLSDKPIDEQEVKKMPIELTRYGFIKAKGEDND